MEKLSSVCLQIIQLYYKNQLSIKIEFHALKKMYGPQNLSTTHTHTIRYTTKKIEMHFSLLDDT